MLESTDMLNGQLRIIASFAAAGFLCLGPAQAQVSRPSPCGETVTVARGDTLSRIAERCDVSEASLLRANPGIQGSADLQVGTELRLQQHQAAGVDQRVDQAVDRLGALASRAGSALEDIAGEIGSSVEDLLTKNPDLHDRLRRLGDRLGVPGVDAQEPSVSISPESGPPGTAVTVSAVGLPPNATVAIGAGRPRSAFEVLERARTSADGTLQVSVRAPDWASDANRYVFVVTNPERGLTARSAPFQVTGRGPPAGATKP
jgi:LysM repeat protein